MRARRVNERYLPAVPLPDALAVADALEPLVLSADLALIAVTTTGLRDALQRVKAFRPTLPVIWLCKGFEQGQAKMPHEIAAEVLGAEHDCGVLSGPSFAEEVARGLPTAVTLASRSPAFARDTARELHGPAFRVYSSDDLIGVEVAGAVKNVMAIAAGISDGLRCGLNARAALVTRGLAEITRLGVALGGRPETFMGLAGAGDLILTCTGDLSRNRQVGLRLAEGKPLETILAELGHVAEGVSTSREVDRMATRLDIDMPITRAVCRVLEDHTQARAAAEELLKREPKTER
jgi:glycerol-3-phosphate dehydrogenase (NAD(P)+)